MTFTETYIQQKESLLPHVAISSASSIPTGHQVSQVTFARSRKMSAYFLRQIPHPLVSKKTNDSCNEKFSFFFAKANFSNVEELSFCVSRMASKTSTSFLEKKAHGSACKKTIRERYEKPTRKGLRSGENGSMRQHGI